MAKSFELTKRNFNIVKNKFEKQHHQNFECASKGCRQPFRVGDVVIRNSTGNRYYHASCLEKMRV